MKNMLINVLLAEPVIFPEMTLLARASFGDVGGVGMFGRR
jgi:hypothetical protein